MDINDNQNELDQALSEALGSNNARPDFDTFCRHHAEAVDQLQRKAPAHQRTFDGFSDIFSVLSRQMLRPVRIPVGICLLLVFLVVQSIWRFAPPGAGIAWAEIDRRMQTIQQVQFYQFDFRENDVIEFVKGRYHQGSIEKLKSDGTRSVDDGRRCVVTASDGTLLTETDSEFANMTNTENMKNFFEVLTKGILQYQQEQIDRQRPSEIAEDFLIYHFSPSDPFKPWLESIVITVGKKSLLPVQMKLFYKDSPGRHDIFFFEYSVNTMD